MSGFVVGFIDGSSNVIVPLATFVTALSTLAGASLAFWWYMTKPKLYVDGFVPWEPHAEDKPNTDYHVRLCIRRLRLRIREKEW